MNARGSFSILAIASLPLLLSGTGFGQHYVLRPAEAFVPMAKFGPESPAEGLDGHCPVTLCLAARWVKGKENLRAEFEGRTYFLASKEHQAEFLNDPIRFAPVFSGMDVVQQAELGVLAEGHRSHGVFYRERIFLFVSEEHLQKFWNSPGKYAERYMG